jgi:hypothetical protein
MIVRFLILAVSGAVLAGSAQFRLDTPLEKDVHVTSMPPNGVGSIDMLDMVRSLALNAGIPIGVELARPSESVVTSVAAPRSRKVSSLADALTWFSAQSPGYEWRIIDSVVIVRPKVAWSDPHDPLNQPMERRQLDRETLPDVMQLVSHRLYGRGASAPRRAGLLNGVFSGGSVLDLMAMATRLDGRSVWVVSYAPAWGSKTSKLPNARFGIAVMDFDGHLTASGFVEPPPEGR